MENMQLLINKILAYGKQPVVALVSPGFGTSTTGPPYPDPLTGDQNVLIQEYNWVIAGDDDWESTVLVLRSDLEVIVKSSRREVLAFVQNMLTGKPARDVDILVSDGKAVVATGKTGKDGVFKAAVKSLKDLSNVSLFAHSDDHTA